MYLSTGELSFCSCWYGDLPFGLAFSDLSEKRGFASSLRFPPFPKTQCTDYLNPGALHWVGNSFGITWLSIRFFFFPPLLQLPFPKSGVTNSLDLACMAIFLTSLNVVLASEDPICTIYNILCMQLGKRELCERRPGLSLTGFIKFNRVQHKRGWMVWPLYKISHRCSMSLLSQF